MRLSAAVVLVGFSLVASQTQGPPPRDAVRREDPVGTAIIRGTVVAADTGNPIRRANVTLAPAPPPIQIGAPPTRGVAPGGLAATTAQGRGAQPGNPSINRPRTTVTDLQGGFEFSALPAGSYRLSASPAQYAAQYLTIVYGAKKPSGPFSSDPGQPIQLTQGQVFDKATLALPRGAVIAGRVTDEGGDPLARVPVYTLTFQPGSNRPVRMGSGAQTDDLGQFRIFGLQAGEFLVVAEARGNTFVTPGMQDTGEERTGFITTYYPGTTDEAAAQRVRTLAAGETGGIEIRLGTGRLYRVSGFATDSQGRPLTRSNGQLFRQRDIAGGSPFFVQVMDNGRFQLRDVPAGNYRLVIRQQEATGPATPGAQTEVEFANVPLTIAGADVENLAVATSPGATVTGRVVFEQGPPASGAGQLRVTVSRGDGDGMLPGFLPSPQPAVVAQDQTFTIRNLFGDALLRIAGPGVYLKSITAGAEDITDTPREFKGNDRVTVTLTTRASIVEGTVTDGSGAPAGNAGIIMFSDDKALWRPSATRTRRGASDASGNFRLPGVMAGRYYIAAVPRDRLNQIGGSLNAAFFEQLIKDGTSVVVGEDEQRRVDLKLSEGGQP